MNAFTGTMMNEIIDAMDRTDSDDSVRAVIFTGAGERAFCAGADLTPEDGRAVFSSGEPVSDLSDPRVRDGGGLLTLRLYQSKKPLISACNGAAVGVGVTMQLPMDMRLASDNARYGFVFARRGIVPEACSSWFLPKIVGINQALEWCMTGGTGPLGPSAGRTDRRRARPGTRNCREYLGGFGGDDPGDAVARSFGRSSDGGAQGRQPGDLPPVQRGGRKGRCAKLPRKASTSLSATGFRRYA
jgi:Enoyl-CoA hydratase/isomerase